jgi:LAO/AO transport system kinase
MSPRELARLATALENGGSFPANLPAGAGLIIGVTGPPGAGKSSLVDALISELRHRNRTVAVVAVDPSSRTSGGAILGDRIRMQRHHADPGVFIRSMANRGEMGGLAPASVKLSLLFRGAGFDYVVVETVGVGQDEIAIAAHADVTLVLAVPGMGDDIQAIKAGIMEIADIFVINKADLPGVARTQKEIEAMLSLTDAGHAPPILRTVATTGDGLPELVDELERRSAKQQTPVTRSVTKATAQVLFSIDHLGIAVRSLAEALPFYEANLGMTVTSRETVEHEKVHVAMLPAGDSRVELLEPSSPDSTIAKYIEKRGAGIHHIALKVSDLPLVVTRLRAAGVRLLGEPKHGAGGHLYVFVHPSSTGGVLWELIQG